MACFICPLTGSQMCGVKSCADCGECDLADEYVDGKPSERDYGQGVGIGRGIKTAQIEDMEAGS